MIGICDHRPRAARNAGSSPATRRARKAGVGPGMDATTATGAVSPKSRLDRALQNSTNEKRLKYLAAWAEQFSSWVCFDADRLLLWIEIRPACTATSGGIGVMPQPRRA